MHPIATLIATLFLVAGVLLTGLGDQIPPATLTRLGIPLTGQVLQYLGVLVFAVAAVRLWAWYAPARGERFTITDDALLRSRGLFTKERGQVDRDAVREVQVLQNQWQRWTDVCDVAVFTTGAATAVVVRGLPEPDRLRALLQDWPRASAA
jgi:uncharacterized membrane protein YdbT with pleckstrin-like domain